MDSCADPGIFVRGREGVQIISDKKKKSDNAFFYLCVCVCGGGGGGVLS